MDAPIPLSLVVRIEHWPIAGSFTISRGAKTEAVVVVAELSDGTHRGRGECVPYARYNETVGSVIAAIEAMRPAVAAGLDRLGLQQAMAAGELVAAYGWAASVVNLKKQNIAVKMMNPKEGIMTWVCGLVTTANGQASDADRYDFINAMLTPESGKYLIEQYGYGHSNSESFKISSPESVAALGFTDPNQFLSTGHFFTAVDPAKRQKIIEMWQIIKAGG